MVNKEIGSDVTVLGVLQSIRASAADVLRAVGLDGVLPVDPEEIAKRLGVGVWSLTCDEIQGVIGGNKSFEGVSLNHDGRYWIAIGQNWPNNAKRFTLAHELGHIVLHSNRFPCLHTCGVTTGAVESEANNFAAEMLMPTAEIIKRASLPLALVAGAFGVSPQAAQIRLRNVFRR
jgi:hypothetical protein